MNHKNLISNGEFFYTGNGFDKTRLEIRKYLNFEDWANFNDYKKEMKIVFRVYMPSNWKDGECTCPDFLRNYKCQHYLGVAIRLKNG